MVSLALPSIWEQLVTGMDRVQAPDWLGWAVSGVVLLFSVLWALFGKRAFSVLAIAQGAFVGGAMGFSIGLVMETLQHADRMALPRWQSLFGPLRLSAAGIAGAVLGAVLLAFAGRVLARIVFFVGGGMVGSVLCLLLVWGIRGTAGIPWFVVLLVFVLTGVAALLLSLRYPPAFTGIWGGLGAAVALVWPMTRLFVHVGGPPWLPVLTAVGLGALLGIAGTALQLDREAERQNLRTYS
jgi:hypothetical protein